MAVDADFEELMRDTVTVYPQASVDKYGKRTFSSTGTQYRARLVWGSRVVRDSKGREVIEAGRAIVYGVADEVTDDYRMTLPDGQDVTITSFTTVNDEDGPHHSVIGFGGQ
jgi:hypothetical protein